MTKTPRAHERDGAKPRKPIAADNPEQYKRFREFAREHEANGSKEDFDKSFERIVKSK
jgi:hypothetical protein